MGVQKHLRILISCMLFVTPTLSLAAFDVDINSGFGVGIAMVRFDTSVKFIDKVNDRSIFVDAEGTLDLPDWDTVPVFYGVYRFSQKHALGFAYFQVKRESSLFDFDETLDDVHINGQAQFSDDTRFYNIFYSNTLFEDERSRVMGKIGINAIDINYSLDAQGTITYPDNSMTGTLHEDIGVFAPMPLFGLDFWYAFTPKWGIRTKVELVAGNFNDIRGWVVNSNINARYQFNKHIGAIFGISYFDADITIEDSQERTEVKYGYDGIMLGIHALF